MLGERLLALIATLGIKKVEFAYRVRFTQGYLSMVLSGKRQMPSERFLDAVCREFHVNKVWLLEGAGEMFVPPTLDVPSSDLVLLKKYQSLPLSDQKIIDEIIDAMFIRAKAKSTPEQKD